MSLIADDVDAILSDTPFFNDVSFGTRVTRGNLRTSAATQDMPDGGLVQVRVTTLLIRATTLGTISRGTTITVDGGSYRVDRIDPEMNGTCTRLYLSSLS